MERRAKILEFNSFPPEGYCKECRYHTKDDSCTNEGYIKNIAEVVKLRRCKYREAKDE